MTEKDIERTVRIFKVDDTAYLHGKEVNYMMHKLQGELIAQLNTRVLAEVPVGRTFEYEGVIAVKTNFKLHYTSETCIVLGTGDTFGEGGAGNVLIRNEDLPSLKVRLIDLTEK